ncbi:CvpA family protein [Halomonas sp. McH1-25]|uniref:CvpA family protein n=1 Tax=unclassified Halomonas TaxID=2609666 RepID=UPI001EF6438E|nr:MULTISPECIES: CvpA family protein [unclassified Halomonas]MCG7599148.1 CvpA family protein [Halomonas sp. McH1-25]MCP1344546.1 CvpA family protein [Halomonas sp. FL8]MCP1361098.1 CvpA family protein [Halomonas sp. BBD45]
MTLTWLDWAFLAVLSMSMLAGFLRGLVREALGLGAWIVALLASRLFAQPVADMLEGYIEHPDIRLVLAFILVIFVVVMLCGMVIRGMHAAIEWVGMGFFNRLAGAGFGILRGGAILVLATVIITLTPLVQLQAWQQAQLRPSFEGLRDWTISRIADWERHDPETADKLRSFSLPVEIPGTSGASSTP